jgi:hypothetical protein
MDKFIAQRGDYCLLTTTAYAEVMESAHFLPAALAGWAPENDHVVGYIDGDTIYRLVDEQTWLAVLKDYRQRMLNTVMNDLKRRGLYDDVREPETD